jgi:hypothetical protein
MRSTTRALIPIAFLFILQSIPLILMVRDCRCRSFLENEYSFYDGSPKSLKMTPWLFLPFECRFCETEEKGDEGLYSQKKKYNPADTSPSVKYSGNSSDWSTMAMAGF